MITELHLVHYLPLGTTLLSALFCFTLLRRYFVRRSGPHLLWWAFGIFTYGLGTLLESLVTLHGNTPFLNKAWYVAGALLGGYPLAQGSVYLHYVRRTAHILTLCTAPLLLIVSTLIFLSPINMEALVSFRPTGSAIAWQWLRLTTPFVNLYAVYFLIGTAISSAFRYYRRSGPGGRALGNALIAFGAILPGIGGAAAKGGLVEALYVGEFVGIIFIWFGYVVCVQSPAMEQTVVACAVSQAPSRAI